MRISRLMYRVCDKFIYCMQLHLLHTSFLSKITVWDIPVGIRYISHIERRGGGILWNL